MEQTLILLSCIIGTLIVMYISSLSVRNRLSLSDSKLEKAIKVNKLIFFLLFCLYALYIIIEAIYILITKMSLIESDLELYINIIFAIGVWFFGYRYHLLRKTKIKK